jgi:hypothetical protein
VGGGSDGEEEEVVTEGVCGGGGDGQKRRRTKDEMDGRMNGFAAEHRGSLGLAPLSGRAMLIIGSSRRPGQS